MRIPPPETGCGAASRSVGQTQESPEAVPAVALLDDAVFAGELLALGALFVFAVLFALGAAVTAVRGAVVGASTSV
jgi:hypothetical protein